MENQNAANYPNGFVHKAKFKVQRGNGRNGALEIKMMIIGARTFLVSPIEIAYSRLFLSI